MHYFSPPDNRKVHKHRASLVQVHSLRAHAEHTGDLEVVAEGLH